MPRDAEKAHLIKKIAMEKGNLQLLFRDFKRAIFDRVFKKASEGVEGWDDPSNKEDMRKALLEKSIKIAEGEANLKDYPDVAAYASFLWNFEVTDYPEEE